MGNITGIFDIARQALFANLTALRVVSHNVANANTPSYSRQEVVFSSNRPENSRPGQIGTGVSAVRIRRIYDKYLEQQILQERSALGQADAKADGLDRVEEVFNESSGVGLNAVINAFFDAIQDLSNNAAGTVERTALVAQAQTLTDVFHQMDRQLRQARTDLDTEIRGLVTEINNLASQIADLNAKIAAAELGGNQQANDYRDQRQELLKQLAEKVDIRTLEDSAGRVTVFVGKGSPLVEGATAYALKAVSDADNQNFADIHFDPGGGATTIDITSSITGGRLSGLLTLRDTSLPGFMDDLDRTAAVLVNRINIQHRQGYGLDGSTGNDFFSPLSVTASAKSTNSGTGSVGTTSITDYTALTYDNYEIRFAVSGGTTTYTVVNLRTGSTVTSGTYTDPTTIQWDGLSVQITGSPANGDVFSVSAHANQARDIAVSSTIVSDTDKIAAAASDPTGSSSGPADNGNALLLAAVQTNTYTLEGKTTTIGSYYASLVADVGTQTQQAAWGQDFHEAVLQQLSDRRESLSGVSLDEEAANLMQFQRAYEASARLVRVADELLLTILGMIR